MKYLVVFGLLCFSTLGFAKKDEPRKVASISDRERIQLFDDYYQYIETLNQSKQPWERVGFKPLHDKVRDLWFSLRAELIQGQPLTDFGCQIEAEKANNTNVFIGKINALFYTNPTMSASNKDSLQKLRSDAYSLLKGQFGGLTRCLEKQLASEAPTEKIDFGSLKQEFENLKK